MRAINLIPDDARSGGGAGAAGRSGGVVYIILGALAALVVMTAVWAMTSSGLTDKRAELAQLRERTDQALAGATGLASPADVQSLRTTRTAAVKTLAQQRMDWAGTLDAIARTLPAHTSLTSLDAATAGGAAGAPAPAAAGAAAPVGPTVELNGCSPSQRSVAQLMPRLRTVPGVQGVQLVTSATEPAGAATAGASSAALECPGAAFQMILTLEGRTPASAPGVPVIAAPSTGAPAAAAPTPVPAPAPAGAAQTTVPGTPTSTTGAGQ